MFQIQSIPKDPQNRTETDILKFCIFALYKAMNAKLTGKSWANVLEIFTFLYEVEFEILIKFLHVRFEVYFEH